jgi:hypothetical protein
MNLNMVILIANAALALVLLIVSGINIFRYATGR